MPLPLELHLLLPSLAEVVECSGGAGEEEWEWEEWAWEGQAWEEWAWEGVWELDVVEWVEEEVSGTGNGQEELQVPGLAQPLRR